MIMTMKKILALVLVFILATCSLVSCSNKQNEEDLEALKKQLAELQAEFDLLNNASKELTDAMNDFTNVVNTMTPNDKNLSEAIAKHNATLAELGFSIEDSKVSEYFAASKDITNYVAIRVKGYGTMVVELYPDVAPITVENFQSLVSKGFYDGLIFHRVISGFMIQGGDPKGDGTGGSDKEITGEFAENGIENDLAHTRGVISMARSSAPNSASSQFFICHATASHLDGSYAAFGQVVYGIKVVDRIASVETNSKDKPLTDVVITSISFVTPIEAD